MKKMIFAGLALSMVSLSAQAQSCDAKLAKLTKAGVSLEALREFQKDAGKAGILDQVAGKDKIVLADLGLPSSQKRLFVLDLKSGEIVRSEITTHGRGNIADETGSVQELSGSFTSGKHANPGGLMKIGESPRVLRRGGYGLNLNGMESSNRAVLPSGIMLQTCGTYVDNFTAKKSSAEYINALKADGFSEADAHEIVSRRSVTQTEGVPRLGRSMGSFCVPSKSFRALAKETKGKFMYSVRPQETVAPVSPGQKAELCGLFETGMKKAALTLEENSQANRFAPSDDMSEAVVPGVEFVGGQETLGLE